MTRNRPRAAVGAGLAAAALLAGPALGGAPEPSESCAFGYDPPVACRVSATAAPDGTTTVTYRAAGRAAVFRGRSQSGWWAGELNGAPAMGYELNRGHVVYSSRDLKTVFEHWSAGMRHGTY